MNDKIKELGEIALGSRLKRLSDRFMDDVARIYRMRQSEFEPRWFTLTYLLYNSGRMSVLDIAGALKLTHPAVVQFINEMSKKGLISSAKDETDKRKRMVELSEKGKEMFESVMPVLPVIESAVKELIDSTGYNFMPVLELMEKQLDQKGLFERVNEKLKNSLMEEIEIVEYKKEYAGYFENLNVEWLEKYFAVEPEDEKILSNPESEIINKGGMIFFARINNEIVGTCSAIKVNDDVFELAKMAVTEKAQGKQAGKKLALVVIGYAISQKAKAVILETASKLTAAISLYEKLGFIYVPFDHPSKYTRTTFKMKLNL
jgi:DNA-binding MarR family transcriptional regulator/GNAT superfamily N-acetyltransferase